jgi:hypothetical protein
MAVTLVEEIVIPLSESAGLALVFGTITFDSTYPSGGEVIDAPGDRDYLKLWDCGSTAGVYVPRYDAANKKLRMLSPTTAQTTGLVETTTTDLSAQIVSFGAIRPA